MRAKKLKTNAKKLHKKTTTYTNTQRQDIKDTRNMNGKERNMIKNNRTLYVDVVWNAGNDERIENSVCIIVFDEIKEFIHRKKTKAHTTLSLSSSLSLVVHWSLCCSNVHKSERKRVTGPIAIRQIIIFFFIFRVWNVLYENECTQSPNWNFNLPIKPKWRCIKPIWIFI